MSEYNYQPLIPTRKPTFTSYVQCGSNEPTTPPQGPKITSYVKVDADETYTLLYLKKDTEANWLANSSYIPKAGEPCLTLDGEFAHQIKFGDGVKTWGELPYSGVAKFDGDDKTIVFEDGIIRLAGADEATAGQMMRIAEDGNSVEWFTPNYDDLTANLEEEISNIKENVNALNDKATHLQEGVDANADSINDLHTEVSQKASIQLITWEADD